MNKDKWLDLGLLWLRVLVGLGIAYHGYGKIFGGHVNTLAGGLAQRGLPMPQVWAWAAALSEFAGGLCVALGLLTRVGAFFICCTMSFALFIHHAKDPWQVKELAFLYWSASSTLVLTGAGRFSLDKRLFQRH